MFHDATILFYDMETSVNSYLVTSSRWGEGLFLQFWILQNDLDAPSNSSKFFKNSARWNCFRFNEAASQTKKIKTVKTHDLFLTKKVADAQMPNYDNILKNIFLKKMCSKPYK